MKIFITGIRGFLGASLARTLEARGHRVTGSSSSSEGTDIARVFASASLSIRPSSRIPISSFTARTISAPARSIATCADPA